MTLCTLQGWSPPPSGAELRALGQLRGGLRAAGTAQPDHPPSEIPPRAHPGLVQGASSNLYLHPYLGDKAQGFPPPISHFQIKAQPARNTATNPDW